jgi:enoyl-CoA hydratase/carnithine racemase
MTNERVAIAVSGGIADVQLNRPDKLNAIDAEMFRALSEASAQVAATPGVRAVVLSGSGRAFCAGLDLGGMASDTTFLPASITERTHGIANLWQHAVWGWRELAVPVIAAVHGACFGGGLQIALAADIRIVAPDARLAVMEARWGLVPDMAGIALLRGLVRDDVARELTYTARQVNGAEAVALGLATQTSAEPHQAALALAAQIARTSPRAVQGAKRLFALAQDGGAAPILAAESREQEALLHGPDIAEAVTRDARPVSLTEDPPAGPEARPAAAGAARRSAGGPCGGRRTAGGLRRRTGCRRRTAGRGRRCHG